MAIDLFSNETGDLVEGTKQIDRSHASRRASSGRFRRLLDITASLSCIGHEHSRMSQIRSRGSFGF